MKFSHLNTLNTLAVALLTMTLAACDKPNTEQANDAKAESNDNSNYMQIGSDMTFPPYEYLDGDKPAGFDIELMDAIAKKAGIEAEYMDTRFVNLISGLDAKKYDAIISALYINSDRLQKYDMIPYFITDEALVVTADSKYQPKTAMDLCGKTISTMKGAILAKQLHDISKNKCQSSGKDKITVREFPSSPEAIQALLSGAVEAHYDDVALATSAVKKLDGKISISSTDSFYPMVAGIVVRKDDKKTYKLINESLDALRESGEYKTLLTNYGLKEANMSDLDQFKSPENNSKKEPNNIQEVTESKANKTVEAKSE